MPSPCTRESGTSRGSVVRIENRGMNRRKRTRYLIRRLIRTTLRARPRNQTEKKRHVNSQRLPGRRARTPRRPAGAAVDPAPIDMPPPGGAAAPPNVNGAAASAGGANATAGEAPAPNAGTADAGAAPNVNPVDASDVTGGFASRETFFAPSPSSAAGAPERERRRSRRALRFRRRILRIRAELELVFPPLKSRSAAPSRESSSSSRPFLLFERRIDPAPSARLGGAASADPNENAGGATTAPVSSLVFAAAPFAAATLRRSRREADRRARLERSSGPSPPHEAVHVSAGSRPVT